VIGLATLAVAYLGMWASGEVIKTTFSIAGSATSFNCQAPVSDEEDNVWFTSTFGRDVNIL